MLNKFAWSEASVLWELPYAMLVGIRCELLFDLTYAQNFLLILQLSDVSLKLSSVYLNF